LKLEADHSNRHNGQGEAVGYIGAALLIVCLLAAFVGVVIAPMFA